MTSRTRKLRSDAKGNSSQSSQLLKSQSVNTNDDIWKLEEVNAQNGKEITETQKSSKIATIHEQKSNDLKKSINSLVQDFTSCDVSPLDQTSDFAGGCSPFKYTAAKALIKQNNVNKKKKTVGSRKSRKILNSASSEVIIEDTEEKGAHCENDIGSDRNVIRNDTNSAGCNYYNDSDQDGDRKDDDSNHIKNDEENGTKECSACQTHIPKLHFSSHVKECLRNRFQRKSKTEEATVEIFFCQICQDDISKLSEGKRVEHYNTCLDKSCKEKTEDEKTQEDTTVCYVCRKNIGHLNPTRQTQHINRCMDQEEDSKKRQLENQKALDAARNKVLDCPICGQKLKTQNSRKVHVKKCAKQFDIPGSVMIERIRQQEEEYALQLEAGIFPSTSKNPIKKKKGGAKKDDASHLNVGDTALAIALSNSLRDEEERNKRCSLEEFAVPANIKAQVTNVKGKDHEHLNQPVVDAFSLLMTPTKPKEKSTKKRKKNKDPAETPVLLKQSALDAHDKLVQKATEVISNESARQYNKTPAFKLSHILKRLQHSKEDSKSEKVSYIWKKTCLKEQVDHTDRFYVKALMPPITPCNIVIGSKIKKMSEIPGWNPLPQEQLSQTNDNSSESLEDKVAEKANRTLPDETVFASTQTAVHLAELLDITGVEKSMLDQTVIDKVAGGDFSVLDSPLRKKIDDLLMNKSVLNVEIVPGVDAESNKASFNEGDIKTERLHSRSLISEGSAVSVMDHSVFEEAASGFIVEEDAEKELITAPVTSLLNDLGSMVGNVDCSDIMFLVKHGEEIPVHSFMLAARCPLLYKECKQKQKLNLNSCSKDSVIAFLKYLYTGSVDIDQIVLDEVKNLSEQFQLQELSDHCDKLLKVSSSKPEPNSGHQNFDKTLQNILKDVWGSDEEYESDDSSEGDIRDDQNEFSESEQVEQQAEKVLVEEDLNTTHCSERSSPSIALTQKVNHIDRLRTMSDRELLHIVQSQEQYKDNMDPFGDDMIDCDISCEVGKNEDEKISLSDSGSEREDYEVGNTSTEHAVELTNEQFNNQDRNEVDSISITKVLQLESSSPAECNNERSLSNSPELFSVRKPDPKKGSLSVDRSPASSGGENSGSDLFDSFCHSESPAKSCNRSLIKEFESPGKENESGVSTPSPVFTTQVSRSKPLQLEAVSVNLLNALNQEDGEVICIDDEQNFEKPDSKSNEERENDEDSQSDTRKRKRNSTSSSLLNISQPILSPKRTRHESPLHRSIFNATKRSRDQSCQTPPSSQKKFPKLRRLCPETPKMSNEVDNVGQMESCVSEKDDSVVCQEDDCNVSYVDGVHDEEESMGKDESISEGRMKDCDLTSYGKHNISSVSDSNGETTESPKNDVLNVNEDNEESEETPGWNTSNMAHDAFEGFDEPEAFYEDYNYGASLSPSTKSPRKKLSLVTRISSESEGSDIQLPDLSVNRQNEIHDVSPASDALRFGSCVDNEEVNKPSPKALKKFCFKSSKLSTLSPDKGEEETGDYERVTEHASLKEHTDKDDKQSTVSIESTNAVKNIEENVGMDFESDVDDGVLNMYMDGVEKDQHDEEFDPPTDVSSIDASFLDAEHPNLLKTPAIPTKKRKAMREWLPPSPFTPMPQYDNMATPQLKKQCAKYGVRALPKKKMLGILKDIYQKSHQYETDSEYEPGTPASCKPATKICPPPEQLPHATKQKGIGKKGKSATGKGKVSKSSTTNYLPSSTGMNPNTAPANSESDDVSDVLNSSFEEKGSDDLPEESFICSQQSSPISKRDLAYKRKQVWDHIQSHEELYLKILHFEPLEFDDFHQELKSAGISLGKQVLMDFLDDKCIQFSLRGSRKPARKRRGGSPRKRGRGRGRGRATSASHNVTE